MQANFCYFNSNACIFVLTEFQIQRVVQIVNRRMTSLVLISWKFSSFVANNSPVIKEKGEGFENGKNSCFAALGFNLKLLPALPIFT